MKKYISDYDGKTNLEKFDSFVHDLGYSVFKEPMFKDGERVITKMWAVTGKGKRICNTIVFLAQINNTEKYFESYKEAQAYVKSN